MPSAALLERLAEQRRTLTEPARQAYREELERLVDPDGTMEPREKMVALRALRSDMMKHLGRKSGATRAQTAADRALDELIDMFAAAVADRLPKAS